MALAIKHSPQETWLAGPRVHIFSIESKLYDAAGEVVLIDDPTDDQWQVENREPNKVPATETVEYTMPERPNAGFILKYLKEARPDRMGAEAAMGWLFELAIGEEAYEALSNESDMTIAELSALMQTVQTRALGGLDAPKGR